MGVYKPVASGCRREGGAIVSDDATALWEAAGRPGTLDDVCPQRFLAPLAPHLAARAEGRQIDTARLRQGIDVWRARSDLVLVEGAGGLMSPIGDEYVADLAADFGYPLLIVAANRLGAINHTLQTLIAAASFRGGLEVAGIVINQPDRWASDRSLSTNREEVATRRRAGVGRSGLAAAGIPRAGRLVRPRRWNRAAVSGFRPSAFHAARRRLSPGPQLAKPGRPGQSIAARRASPSRWRRRTADRKMVCTGHAAFITPGRGRRCLNAARFSMRLER